MRDRHLAAEWTCWVTGYRRDPGVGSTPLAIATVTAAGAVGYFELVEDAGQVALDGGLGDEQPPADVGIGQSLRDEAQYLDFAEGQFGAGRLAYLGGQSGGHRRREYRLAAGRVAHALGQLCSGAVLPQVPGGPGG